MTKAMDDWAKMPLGRVITDEEMHRRTHPAWPYNYFNPGQPVDPAKVDELLKGGIGRPPPRRNRSAAGCPDARRWSRPASKLPRPA